MLWGAIIGDIVGSIYEFSNIKTKKFPFFPMNGYITDDSCMTIAVADALMKWKHDGGDLQQLTIQSMRQIGFKHPNMGYGFGFAKWLFNKESNHITVGVTVQLCVYLRSVGLETASQK